MLFRRSIAAVMLLGALVIGIVLFSSREKWRTEESHPGRPVLVERKAERQAGTNTERHPGLPRQEAKAFERGSELAQGRVERQQPRVRSMQSSLPVAQKSGWCAPDTVFAPRPLARIEAPRPMVRHDELAAHPGSVHRMPRDPATVRAVLLAAAERLRERYRAQLRLNPELEGDLEVRLEVEPVGRVSRVEVVGGSLSEAPFSRIVTEELSRVVFPAKLDAGARELYRQRFVFQPRT